MASDSPEQRRTNLRKLRAVFSVWHYLFIVVALILLPALTQGTAFHEVAVQIRSGGVVGVLLSGLYVKWSTFLFRWHEQRHQEFGGPRFTISLLAVAAPGALIAYAIFRVLKHEGNWAVTLAFSWPDAMASLVANVFMALGAGVMLTVVTAYRRGYDVVLKEDREPLGFWGSVVLPILVMLLPVFVMAFVMWFRATPTPGT